MVSEITLILILLVILAFLHRKSKKGKVTLGPGSGTTKIITGFRPKKVKVKFCKSVPIPGCSQLEDKVDVVEIHDDGFVLEYDIKSGARTIKWRASK